jgi:hypothetical protein
MAGKAKPHQKEIEDKLGVSHAGLLVLQRKVFLGARYSGGKAGEKLQRLSLVDAEGAVTRTGRQLLAEARSLGW